ncbi:MAG: GMC oxidoreductase [Vicinamibacterales bacterium]
MQDNERFDAIVVGSGASGGWAAKRLCEAGLKVAVVDAGRRHTTGDFREHKPDFELKYRNRAQEVIRRTRPRQSECYACTEHNYDWFANDLEEPYTTPAEKPFSWQGRMRIMGGRTNVWARQSYRFSDLDFKAASADGHGMDWPLGYADLAPYYDIVEDYVGISGLAEGVYELPDGKFLPAMPFTCPEVRLRARAKEKFGRTVTIGRTANLTRPVNGRAACHYCGPCERGCVTHSYFNSAFTTMADALATGNCTHIPDAMVYKVLTDPDAPRARGVLYIDRRTRQPREVFGRVVVLCAQALESVRVLFNSATPRFSNGLANSSGVLGHYLQDHVWNGGGATGEFHDVPEKPSLGAPRRPNGIYVIRFRNTRKGPKSNAFLRGYGFQGGWGGVDFNWGASGFGQAFKSALLEPVVSMNLGGFGECLARHSSFVEIDRDVVDVFGIPVLRIHMTWSDNERAMIADMATSAAEMLEAAGARNVRPWTVVDRMPGMGIHEVGVARMGVSAKRSVLNQFQQTHDVKNLFVMDGSCFTSSACQNPTLTIMALAVRSCDYLLNEMKRGVL